MAEDRGRGRQDGSRRVQKIILEPGPFSAEARPKLPMRKFLDGLYIGAGYFGAVFMIGTLVAILLGIASREIGFLARGTDAYAGYCMAAASFLALAHTLKRGEHIRVTLILQHVGAKAGHGLEIFCHVAGFFLSGALAWFSVRLAWQSYTFHDISQGNDATPLWIPQIGMAIGAAVLFVALADDLMLVLRGEKPGKPSPDAGPARIE